MKAESDITGLLADLNNGSQKAYDRLLPLVYNQLKDLANRQLMHQPAGHTYSKTDLVHEAYLKLVNHPLKLELSNRSHFFGIASRCMRSLLIDYARKKMANKRGGRQKAVTYIDQWITAETEAENLIDLDQALQKLNQIDERLVQVVELRYFAELGVEETAEILGISSRTVKREWAKARGLLYQELK